MYVEISESELLFNILSKYSLIVPTYFIVFMTMLF